MNGKITVHYLVGDVHKGGHDLHRVARAVCKMLGAAGCFSVLTVCDDADIGDMSFDDYFAADLFGAADVFIFNCGSYRFNVREEQKKLEAAVSDGAGFVFLHGDHPCYWVAAGFEPWAEIEKMSGLMWREKTSHGDFAEAHITVDMSEHPIMRGIGDFDTKDEIFCNCENIWNVPVTVLASAYSDEKVLSRHGHPGTGRQEPILTVGQYGRGRTVNHLLGHVWPFYTGHGLGENTMLSFVPREFRKMLVRSVEWAATGSVEKTLFFDGNVKLI